MVVINLRLAQALGRSSRVAGSHDSGGDGEGSGAGRPGELGDGLTQHLDCVDGCKEEGWCLGLRISGERRGYVCGRWTHRASIGSLGEVGVNGDDGVLRQPGRELLQ